MEDDDEFGDLYSDVLKPFTSAGLPPSQPSTAPQLHRPVDSNLQSRYGDDNLLGAPRPIPDAQTLATFNFHPPVAVAAEILGSIPNRDDSPPKPMFLDSKREPADGNDVIFDIEEGSSKAIECSGSDDPIIPGLTEWVPQGDSGRYDDDTDNGIIGGGGGQVEAGGVGGKGEGDDWDSDSEDDLQIVLDDNNHGPMAMEKGGMMGEDDEDGDPLVIVADGDANQGMEEQDWGEGGGQAADGEGKEGGEVGKLGSAGSGGGSVVVPKIGNSSHGFHPLHSQFKYVRPGAAPMPGVTAGGPGGAPAQVRPVMGTMVSRGRGDWRPPGLKAGPSMQKGFHPSFGMPGWGNNMGRGIGGGLDFTLPSHKTIFEVDIDSFEEKPWKYPGVDLSDFFNFGLNEESWKDYCKQLEQRRLETTMQSKIRVYESGRTEQDYDPDLPPELAAATGQEIPADAANFAKSNGGQNDLTKGTALMRPPLPTGRAIQVEGGSGERLPSIDTRPPRIRDSDAVIEIVCQDTLDDDSSTGIAVKDRTENDLPGKDLKDLATETDIAHEDTKYVDGFTNAFSSRMKEVVERTMSSVRTNVNEDDGILPFSAEASRPYGPGSRSQSPMYHNGDFGSPRDERHRKGSAHERSPRMTPIRGKRDKFTDSQSHEEESVESMDHKSPLLVREIREVSVELKGDVDDKPELADRSHVIEKDVLINDTHNDESSLNEKLSSQVEQQKLQESEGCEDSMAARISENSEARSGSSRDYQKWRDSADDEVVQGGRSSRIPIVKKHLDEHGQNLGWKDRGARREIERSQIVGKPREGSYSLRDFDAGSSHKLHIKMEGFDRRRESDNLGVAWQQREDDFYNRKRTGDFRKRERDEEIGSRNRAKVRESERSDNDYPSSRKQLDNGIYKVHHDKDVSTRHTERNDNLKSRYETTEDYHNKRRKDEEYLRRDNTDKEVILHGNRESSSSHRKRERDEFIDPHKRAEQQRTRENFDHQSVRDKDEVWFHREGVEKQRERDERHRAKQSHDESLSKREREEGRGTARSGRGSEDKAWVGRSRTMDELKVSEKEYQLKKTVRHSEQVKRRDRNDDESFSRRRGREDSYALGRQFSNDDRKSRQERTSTWSEHAVNAPDNQRGHEKKHKENNRKNGESEGGDPVSLGSAKRNQDNLSGHYNEMGSKSHEKNEDPVHYNSSRKRREDASSGDELKESTRGRSKLERWTSHKERDYSINSKSSSSSKFKEIEKSNNVEASESNKTLEEPGTPVEPAENHHPLSDEPETKDADPRPSEDRHLDTVEKLKKRSERFKLPIPKENDAVAIKKMENEAPPSSKNKTPADSEIKPERPARKRRWISK